MTIYLGYLNLSWKTSAAFLDVEKAVDNVWHNGLRYKIFMPDLPTKMTFKHSDILDRCNIRYHRLKLVVSQKWGPSPSTIIQISKQRLRPIIEYGSLSTITTSDNIISKIQRFQSKFIRIALHLPKYICP